MTNTEAITKLTNIMHDDHYSWYPSILTAFNMAVDALRGAEGDCISRVDAIKAVHDEFDGCLVWDESGERTADEVELILDRVPSAQPELPIKKKCTICPHCYNCDVNDDGTITQPEQRWIPCSERLPKEYGEYICTMENGQVQECGFVPENQRGLADGWSTCEADGHKFLGYADVLAWMPLPEVWKEGEADEAD